MGDITLLTTTKLTSLNNTKSFFFWEMGDITLLTTTKLTSLNNTKSFFFGNGGHHLGAFGNNKCFLTTRSPWSQLMLQLHLFLPQLDGSWTYATSYGWVKCHLHGHEWGSHISHTWEISYCNVWLVAPSSRICSKNFLWINNL